MSWMIGSSVSDRAFQASQSPLVLRQTQLDDLLAYCAAEQRRQRTAHAASVGPGQISASNQTDLEQLEFVTHWQHG